VYPKSNSSWLACSLEIFQFVPCIRCCMRLMLCNSHFVLRQTHREFLSRFRLSLEILSLKPFTGCCAKLKDLFSILPHVPYGLRGIPSRLWPKCNRLEVGTPIRHNYVVPMKWMVIYEYEVPGGALNLSSTNYPDHGHHGNLPLQGKFTMVEPGESNPGPHSQ
jgi:hypothetical protein